MLSIWTNPKVLFSQNKILAFSKLKAFADDKTGVVKMISLLDRVKNTVGKGENDGYQHFLLCPHCFPKTSFKGSLEVRIVWYRVNP